MQTIITKYIGPTNFKGARVKATSTSGKSITVSWNHEMNADGNHRAAMIELLNRLDWKVKQYARGNLTGGAMVWVAVTNSSVISV